MNDKLSLFKKSLDLYVNDHIEPGSFLRAVLEGDLFGAMGRADLDSRVNLFELMNYIYENIRSDCYGDKLTVQKWLFEK